jgi:hypothetical protein
MKKMRNVKRMAAATNRLRTEGTDHRLAAGRAVGVRTFVAQSNYALLERTGGPVVDERGRIDPSPPKDVEEAVADRGGGRGDRGSGHPDRHGLLGAGLRLGSVQERRHHVQHQVGPREPEEVRGAREHGQL